MTIVLVHGVPETARLWDPLRAHLPDDVVALELPGFGNPRPPGFGATKEEYVDWLVSAVADLGRRGPVDLVGHDWGGGLAVRLVSLRPELVRSWVTDAAALADPAYEWHDNARLFQTPEVGEEIVASLAGLSPEQQAESFSTGFGIPRDRIGGLTGIDQTMADCILALYRSAPDIGDQWKPGFTDVPSPGLVVVPGKDPFLPAANTRAAAARAGARLAELPESGHWWMLEDPPHAAAVLQEFWASLPA